MRWLARDLKLALRGLVAGRLTTIIAVLTLGLGIGVGTAVFSVLDSVLVRPFPFREGSRYVEMWNFNPQGHFYYAGFTPALVREWRSQTDIFDRVEAYNSQSLVYSAPEGAEMISGAAITPGLIGMLAVAPSAGRLFVPGEGQRGADHFVIVSDRFWRTRLHRNPDAIGARVTLNNEPYAIVGVMPASFRFPSEIADVWVPFDVDHPPDGSVDHARLEPFARLRRGLDFAQGSTLVSERGTRLSTAAGESAAVSAMLIEPAELGDPKTRRSLLVLGGAVGFLLLIVCANLANLTLSRSLSRAKDMAIRAALGASRWDLIRSALIEHVLLAAIGTAAGLIVAEGVIAATLAVIPESMIASSLNAIDLDGRAIAFSVIASAVSVIMFGLPPAFVASRAAITDVLRRDSRSSSGSPAARRLRASLVVVEVSLSIVLLVGAALMTRSLLKLQGQDAGFDTRRLISLRLGLPAATYGSADLRDRLAVQIADRIRLLPGVIGATVGGLPAERGLINFGQIEFADRPGALTPRAVVPLREVPGGYFQTLGIPVQQGHVFRADDPDGAVIVSHRFAAKFLPAGVPVGARFRFANGPWRTIVGVVGDVRPLTDDHSDGLEIYYPLGAKSDALHAVQDTSIIGDYRTLVIRADQPATMMALLPQAVHAIDPSIVIAKTDLVDHVFADALARPRIVFLMMSVFAVFGLLLAAAGIYGVLSCLVEQRLREIGIRLALGASRGDAARLILGSGLALTGTGLVTGLALALALVRVMRTLLYDVEPSDPASVALVATVLLVTAAIAAWIPTHRAMRVNPATLLRED
jgi:putative ABC transport system permease protein